VIAFFDGQADEGKEDGTLSWPELPNFVAMHSWEAPSDVRDIAEHVVDSIRDRRGRAEALEKNAELVQGVRGARVVLKEILP
jgi:hypothetical protein